MDTPCSTGPDPPLLLLLLLAPELLLHTLLLLCPLARLALSTLFLFLAAHKGRQATCRSAH